MTLTNEQTFEQQQIPVEFKESYPKRVHVNVGRGERNWCTIGGAGLVALGLARRSLGGLAVAAFGGALLYRGVAGHCPMYQALGIDTSEADADGAKPEEYFERGIHVEHSVTVNAPPDELYRFWRDFTNLPQFMQHLQSVQIIDNRKSRWVAKGPAGMNVEWDAEIINDEPDRLIAWRSLGGAEVDNAGSVRFVPAPAGRGTEVRVVLDYIPPAGKVGSIIARLFGEAPEIQVKGDLRRFKQLMETGEIPTTEGQPRGTCGGGGERPSHA